MNVKLTFPVVLFLLLCLNNFLPAKSVECPALTNPRNGLVVCSSRGYLQENDRCTFSCNHGYHLLGSSQVECGADGQWSGTVPTCAVECPVLTSPQNGRGDCTDRLENGRCTFSCNYGYHLLGSSQVVCGSDGQWTGTVPTCAACPSGYTYRETNRLCYKAYNLEKDYNGAKATCSSDSGTLAMPRDAVTNTFLINLKNAVDNSAYFWFGLTDIQQEGRWVWEDGTALGGFSSWESGQPDNWENEDCGEYRPANHRFRNKWNDRECSYNNRKFICQVPPT